MGDVHLFTRFHHTEKEEPLFPKIELLLPFFSSTWGDVAAILPSLELRTDWLPMTVLLNEVKTASLMLTFFIE